MHEREKHTSGPEGRLVLMMVVRAKARTYPTGFFRKLFSPGLAQFDETPGLSNSEFFRSL